MDPAPPDPRGRVPGDETCSHGVARVEEGRYRFGRTWCDVPAGAKSAIGVFVAVIVGFIGVIGSFLVAVLTPAPWWTSLLVLAGAAAIGAMMVALFRSVPPRQVRLRATFTREGVRWDHHAGYLRTAAWRQVRWQNVSAVRRLRTVLVDDRGVPVEHNWVGIVFADGTWTPMPVPVRRDLWFQAFAQAHHDELVPWDVVLEGFDRMPDVGEPLTPSETLPADRQVEIEQTRIQMPL